MVAAVVVIGASVAADASDVVAAVGVAVADASVYAVAVAVAATHRLLSSSFLWFIFRIP